MGTEEEVETEETRCPSCGDPVGERAPFCMHCGEDLPQRVEYDDVTGAGGDAREERARGQSGLLGRLRGLAGRGETATASVEATGTPPVVEPDRRLGDAGSGSAASTGAEGAAGREDRSFAADREDRSLAASVASRLVPAAVFERTGETARFLVGLTLVAVAGFLGLGLGPTPTAALVATVAWLGSVRSLFARHSEFDAIRYSGYGFVALVVFTPFAFSAMAEGVTTLGVALALVPAVVSTLLVAGFGNFPDWSPVE